MASTMRAHPRSRGENLLGFEGVGLRPGSSPLTRGKHSRRRAQLLDGGLIPAHAGKTTVGAGPGGSRTAHPRSRGENTRRSTTKYSIGGSSPLTRGKPSGSRRTRALLTAHPRSRGENIWGSPTAGVYKGSSPLTRGKLRHQAQNVQPTGLIPAHAGKTVREPPSIATARAHPRSRGENVHGHVAGERQDGSSPLTRGKH